MDLLYTRRFDGFCLISSDSDFTGLAVRIREEGLTVYGFGERKTPEAFRNSCHKFILTEVLRPTSEEPPDAPPMIRTDIEEATNGTTNRSKPAEDTPSQPFPREFVLEALGKASDDTGWAHLGTFGSYLTKLQPDFDSRLFGYKKLSDLVRTMKDVFQCEERKAPGSDTKVLYVRANNTTKR